jgi:hypothetical protein
MDEAITPGKGPMKLFVDSFHCRIVNGLHMVSFGSGEDQFQFVLQLPASKTFARALTKQIQEIEKKTGKEITDLGLSDEPVVSPIKFDGEGKELR